MSKEKVESTEKTRSSAEKMLVWGAIAILGIIVLIEFRSQKNFNGAMAWLEENETRTKTLADVRAAISGATESEQAEGTGNETAIKFKWFSLFKSYEIIATVEGTGDDARYTGFYDPVAMKLVQEEMQGTLNSTAVDEPAVAGDTSGSNTSVTGAGAAAAPDGESNEGASSDEKPSEGGEPASTEPAGDGAGTGDQPAPGDQ